MGIRSLLKSSVEEVPAIYLTFLSSVCPSRMIIMVQLRFVPTLEQKNAGTRPPARSLAQKVCHPKNLRRLYRVGV